MKRYILLILALLVFFPCMTVSAEIYSDMQRDSGISAVKEALPEETARLLEEIAPELASGQLSGEGMLTAILDIFADGFSAPVKFLVVGIAVILLQGVFTGIYEGEFTLMTQFLSTLILSGSCIVPLLELMKQTESAVLGVGTFMLSFIPVFAGILLAGGAVTSAGGLSALLLFAAETVVSILSKLVMPLLSMFTAISISASSTGIKIGNLAGTIKKVSTWLLSLSLTLFTGVLGLQTTVTSAADTLSMKTARFAAGTFLPVVGGSVGEAMGTVSACVQMLRSTSGAYGVLGIAFILLPILAELIAWRLSMLLCEGVAELFSAEKIAGLLKSVGAAVSLLVGIVIWTGLLFIISLTVLMKVGGNI